MRTFLTACFYLLFALSAVSIFGLFTLEFQRADVIIATLVTALTVLLYVARYAFLVRFGRLGLLKPKLHWKPFKPEVHRRALVVSAALFSSIALSNRANTQENAIDVIALKEMLKIKALGYNKKTRSDEELVSENKLLRYIEMDRSDRTTPPSSELRGVRHKDVFLYLRKIVDDWYAERAHRETAYQNWLVEVGETDQSHLLKDGWIAFLESMPGPDIHLWHGIATDFHEMFGDRLDAAFWIVQQEECDRATASDFIAGYLEYHLSKHYADITKRDERLDRFISIVKAYNAGYFKSHSIQAGLHIGFEPDDTKASDILGEYESVHGLTDLLRPKGLIKSTISPSDPATRGFASPYAFWDDAGLHLEYPRPDWRSDA